MISNFIYPTVNNSCVFNYALNTLRNNLNTSNLKNIYSYTGNDNHRPIYYEEINLFKKMIYKNHLKCNFIEISDLDFSKTLLQMNPKTSLIHIPGAKSSDLDRHIGQYIPMIKAKVEAGCSLLGWCGEDILPVKKHVMAGCTR